MLSFKQWLSVNEQIKLTKQSEGNISNACPSEQHEEIHVLMPDPCYLNRDKVERSKIKGKY